MLFEEVKLSQKSWHYKLMKMTWGNNPMAFGSFCPYFWLTIFNVIVFPITGFIWLMKKYIMFLDSKIFTEKFWEAIDSGSNDIELIYDIWHRNELADEEYKKICSQIPQVKSIFEGKVSIKGVEDKMVESYCEKNNITKSDLYDLFQKIRERRDAERNKIYEETEKKRKIEAQRRREKDEKNALRNKKRKERMDAIFGPIGRMFKAIGEYFKNTSKTPVAIRVMMWTKKIVIFAVGTTVGLLALWGLYHLGLLLYNWEPKWSWLHAWHGFIFPIVAYIALIVIGFFLTVIWNYMIRPIFSIIEKRIEKSDGEKIKKIENMLSAIGKFFTWIFKGIISPFRMIGIYFKAVKNENCPAIVWEEEK